MIGNLNPKYREATVVGAGIAGLLAAYALDKKNYKVSLIEQNTRVGGLIATRTTAWGIAEQAAHSFLASQSVLELCRDLKIELLGLNRNAKAKYIFRNGKLRKFPLNFPETVRTICHLGKSALTGKLKNINSSHNLETWGKIALGTPAVSYLLNPFIRGIYGSKLTEISAAAIFRASKTRARGAMMVPKHGMGALIRALELHLEAKLKDRFKKETKISVLPDTPNLIICTQARAAAELLKDKSPILSSALACVSYTPIVCVTAFVQKSDFKTFPNGVGVLIPEIENQGACLGILFNSSAFENRVLHNDIASFTLMLGGSTHPTLSLCTDKEILAIVSESLHNIIDFAGTILHLEISRQTQAIPQYGPELIKVWHTASQERPNRSPDLLADLPGHVLFGNYTGEVSLRGLIETSLRFC